MDPDVNPNDGVVKKRGILKYDTKDYRGALEDMNIADEIKSNDPFTLSYRGAAKLKLGDYQGSLEDLNRADQQLPNTIFILENRGATKRKLRDFGGALADLNRADKMQPSSAYILKNRGASRRRLGDLKGAFEDLNRADEIEPNDAFTLRYRGAIKLMLGDNQGALEDLNRADEIKPNNAFTLRYLGATQHLLGDFQGALEDLNRSIELEPTYSFALHYRGATKLMVGDYEGALEDLNRANKIRQNNAATIQQRAIARYHLNDFAKALKDIIRAIKLDSTEESVMWKSKIEEGVNGAVIDKPTPQANTASNMQSYNLISRFDISVVQEGVNQVPCSELKVIKTLGEGGFGEVSLAEWRGIKVALKKLKFVVDDMSHEAKTLMLFRYKYIVTLIATTADPQTNSTILIMEYMKHGSLEDLLFKQHVKLSRASVIQLALDIALGVNYLHSQTPKVLHRDLKSANVLLHRKKTRAKIADFGTAKFLHSNVHANTAIGNISIGMPPEMLAEEIYDEKVDVFAFGVILYEMLTNKRLSSLDEIYRMKRIRESIDDKVLMQLVLDCCVTDPNKRPHMRDIVDSLRKMKNESK